MKEEKNKTKNTFKFISQTSVKAIEWYRENELERKRGSLKSIKKTHRNHVTEKSRTQNRKAIFT